MPDSTAYSSYNDEYSKLDFSSITDLSSLLKFAYSQTASTGLVNTIEKNYPKVIQSLSEKLKKSTSPSKKTLQDFYNSAFQMYILARYALQKDPSTEYNVIGRLNNPSFPISSIGTTCNPAQ